METAGIEPAASPPSLICSASNGDRLAKSGRTLRDLRLRGKLSQAALGKLAGLSQTEISQLELGKHAPSAGTRARLAEALGVDAPGLFPEVSEPGGRLQLRTRDGGRLLREARLAAGLSQYELAEKSGVRQGHISELEGREGWNARQRTAERVASALGRQVDQLFEPAEHATVGGRTQPEAVPLEHRGVRYARDYANERGYWLVSQAAESVLKVVERTVHANLARGNLRSVEKRMFGGINFVFFEPRAVKEYARRSFESSDGRVKRFYDPLAVELQSLLRGLQRDAAKSAAARAEERRRVHARLRIGKPQPAPIAPHAARWATRLEELAQELAWYETPPTRQELLRLVALEDWQKYPEIWSRQDWPAEGHDPQSLRAIDYRRAAARIRRSLS